MVLNKKSTIMYLLAILMVLSCYQIYLFRIAGSYVPLSAIVMALCIPFVKLSKLKDPIFSLFLLSIILNVISFTWSPMIGLWEYQLVFGYIFIITYSASKELNSPDVNVKLLKIFLLATLPNAFLIILFRLRPDIESIFIINFLDFFKNPDRLTDGALLNVWDENKAGGVFDNANAAASLHLVCIGFIIAIKGSLRKYSFLSLMLMNVLAVIFSGSKSAVMIMIASMLISFALNFLKGGRKDLSLRWLVFVIVMIFLMVLIFFSDSILLNSDFSKDTSTTSEDRINLIYFATDMFLKNPLFGLGYGGWQENIGRLGYLYNVQANWPPHNSIIDAWATSGILNALICVAIILILILRSLRYSRLPGLFNLYGPFISIIGAVIMPLGDPQPFLGSPQIAAPLGVLCCLVFKNLELRRETFKVSKLN